MDAEAYEERWRRYLEKTHQNVIETLEQELDNKKQLEVLDVSAGTGKIHEKLAESSLTFDKLVFNDPDEEMLSEDKKQSIRQAFDCETTFSHYNAENLQYLNKSFDIILSINAYHLYDNKYRFFKEVNRCVKDNGHVLIQDWDNSSWFKPINALITWYDDKPITTESKAQVMNRATEKRFEAKKCKTWQWRWWQFYTILLYKYDLVNDMSKAELHKGELKPPEQVDIDDEGKSNDEQA